MLVEETAMIAADHPALAGHFPGRPVVPGAVLLDMVIGTAEARAQLRVGEVVRMKFHRPLGPETVFIIRLQSIGEGRIEVNCLVGDDPLLSGMMRAAPMADGQSRP
jgi:3-hydroxyacyl-[acyl-carrier-protein] dehydratase